MRTIGRIAVLALSAAGCAGLSGFAALYVQVLVSPPDPNNAAYGMSPFQLLHDPFVLVVFLTIVGGTALPGFLVSLWALRRVQLRKAVPVGYAVTILSAVMGEAVHPLGGPLLALPAAVGYMLYCHGNQKWAIATSRGNATANGAT
jgi:hypothetical protein